MSCIELHASVLIHFTNKRHMDALENADWKVYMKAMNTKRTDNKTSKPWSPEKILYLGGENKPIFRYFLAT